MCFAATMRERARIAHYFAPLSAGEPGSFNLTDDAAVLDVPAQSQLVVTTDSVIQGIHVLADATAQQFAQKLMRRNLSDLAAMGAAPWRYSLNVHTPRGLADDWFAGFAAALREEQTAFGITLIGGDSTSGGDEIHVTMTCFGLLDHPPLRRNSAVVGDDVYVSGTLGDAAYALSMLQQNQPVDAALAARYHAPTPRVALGQKLQGVAHAVIDVSDGLLADLAQICAASGCSARVEQAVLPLSSHLRGVKDAARFALSGGDDYELCFTAPRAQQDVIEAIARELALPLTRIGSITDGAGVTVVDANGEALPVTETGWEH